MGHGPGGAVELSLADWHSQLDVNLTSVFLACKYVIPVMQQHGGGSIINTASASGMRWTGAAQVGYAAAKAGIIQLSKVTAVQYAPDRIRVNTVVPGQLHTPMVEVRLAGQRAGGDVEKLLAQRQSEYRSGSWVTVGTPRTRPCSSRRTKPGSSPVRKLSSTVE